jgi:hypothetical protein
MRSPAGIFSAYFKMPFFEKQARRADAGQP